MQKYGPELNAAIGRFQTQPGITAAEVDQLRTSLMADHELLASLNEAAASGARSGPARVSRDGVCCPSLTSRS